MSLAESLSFYLSTGTTASVTVSTIETISSTASSTTSTNGALIVGGGVGVGGNLNVGGSITVGGVTYTSANLAPATYQTFANGIASSFTLPFTPTGTSGLIATIDGLVEYDYTVSGNTLAFGFVPANNSIIRAFSFGIPNLVSTSTLGPGTVTSSSFAAGAIVGGLGYTPANKAGDSLTGSFTLNGWSITTSSGGVVSTSSYASAYNEWMTLALSDEATAISTSTTGTSKVSIRMPYPATFYQLPRASLSTATLTGSTATLIDIKINGTTILGNKLIIDATSITSTNAATPTTLATTTAPDDAQLSVDLYTAPNTAKGLKVTIYFRRT